MNVINIEMEIFQQFVEIYSIILLGLIAITILLSLFLKVQKRKYISSAKKKLEKIKGKPQIIFYKVEDFIESNIYDLDKCVLIIKGFDTVCDTLRRNWNPDEKLKLVYIIKDEYNIAVELFFDNSGSWKTIEGLHNLSDGINYVNQYEIVVKENEKNKSIQQMLLIICITMLLGIILISMAYFFIGQSTGILKFNRETLAQTFLPITIFPLLLQVIMFIVGIQLQRNDEDSQLSRIIMVFAMTMPVFSILISIVYWYILLSI
jgi:hypothetical protein